MDIRNLSLEEKARLVCGHSTMSTYPIEREGIAAITLSDGPNGLRKEQQNGDSLGGISESLPTTCFPAGVTLASTFNRGLAYQEGEAIAKECQYYHVNVILGPAMNIKRNPLCGRNFEYYSEDPLVSAEIARGFVTGAQNQHIACCPKHFACNNEENHRFTGNSIIEERALREIYLRPFEKVVRNAHPWAMMNSYNQINGTHASENQYITKDILRDEWGFDGVLMTDWGGIVNRVDGLKATTDLEMPGMVEANISAVIEAVKDKRLDEAILNASVNRILKLQERTKAENAEADFHQHYALAEKIAEEGAVLLKNEQHLLPLDPKEEFLVLGSLFRFPRYQGSGSSLLNPYQLSYHTSAWDEDSLHYHYLPGYPSNEKEKAKKLREEALKAATDYQKVIIFCGQSDGTESEGYDRDTMSLPENQIRLIQALIQAKKQIILVLFGGSSVELPFADHIQAILYMGLAGEGIGQATRDLLFGKANPSGKLTETWRIRYEDTPFHQEFGASPQILYKEGIYVGYRYTSSVHQKVLFPFGQGLSYTTFSYHGITADLSGDKVIIKTKLTNLGERKGSDVIEVYSSLKGSAVHRPLYELKGFEKVELESKESKEVAVSIPLKELEVYDVQTKSFVLESGTYTFFIGRNAEEMLLEISLPIEGVTLSHQASLYDDLSSLSSLSDDAFGSIIQKKIEQYRRKKKPYTMETPIREFDTLIGRIFRKAVCGIGLTQYRKALHLPDGPLKERKKKAGLFIYKMMPCNSLRSLCYSSSGSFPYPIARGVLEMINNHPLRGIKEMKKKEK